MYLYQSYEQKKDKINWFALLITFLVALGGSYLAQTFISKIWGTEDNAEIERLSYNQVDNSNEAILEDNSEKIIEQAMQSVVGISKLQVNEESIFDVNLNKKWGIRDRNNSF